MLDATNYLRAHQKSLPGPLLAFEPEIVISVGKSMLVTSLYLSSSNIDERAKVFYEALPQLYKNEMWAFCDGRYTQTATQWTSLTLLVICKRPNTLLLMLNVGAWLSLSI